MRATSCPKCNAPLPEFAETCTMCGETLPLSIPETIPPASLDIEDEGNAPTVRLAPLQRPRGRREQDLDLKTRTDPSEVHDIAEAATQARITILRRPSLPTPTTLPGDRLSEARRPYGRIPGATPPLMIRQRTERVRRVSPSLFFWLSLLVMTALVVGGLFGVAVALGKNILTQPQPNHGQPTLQITPTTIALGAMITIRGSNFTPNGNIGLTRDANIPVMDTGAKHIIRADGSGGFSDTVIVAPDWQAGAHLIHAEDATLHKIAGSTIVATGHSASLRPAHLLLSTGALDLGTGDQATNSTQIIVLSNVGGGEITWQATPTQPWLQISPTSGSFSSGQTAQVAIAGLRANLKPGFYNGQVLFLTSEGQSNLTVKMKVEPLNPGHEAVLQLTPAVLAFMGVDGGLNPPGQVVTVSNPGILPLQWGLSITGGAGWLSVSPQTDTLATGSNEAVAINANIAALLPGTYSAYIHFSGRGTAPVEDSPQSIYVSLTVTPQCSLQLSPGSLTFLAVSGQAAPPAKSVNLSLPQGCTRPVRWSVTSATSWLGISSTKGITPASLSVSARTAGLNPKTYSGTIIFGSTVGTLTLPVSLIVVPPNTPILTTGPSALAFQDIIGQPSPPTQTIMITNSGGSTLLWSATLTTSVGGGWLTASATRGSLGAHATASVVVTATLLSGLSPATYNGIITLMGTDASGRSTSGSPESIPVTFLVQAPCAIAAGPAALDFAGVVGQPDPTTQSITIATMGACAHPLNWTATTSGGSWLTLIATTGTVSPTATATTRVGAALAGLTPGPYSGKVTIAATDSITGQPALAQSIPVTLNAQPPCTLQTPSATQETFNTEVGVNPAAQSFTVGVTGTCNGNVTITPTVTTGSGLGWLSITPNSVSLASGDTVTFTANVAANGLSTGAPYTGSISLAAANGGMTITGSPQTVHVTLNVLAPPTLGAGPASLNFSVTGGTTSQAVTIANNGGSPLNWNAALAAGAPGFISLSASSGTGLAGGASASINVIVDATGLAGGSSFTANLIISATDAVTGNLVAGNPVTIQITVDVAQPSMQLSGTSLAFTVQGGVNPAPQAITLTNVGGDTLTWTAGSPSQGWLSLNTSSGSNAAGVSSTLAFVVDTTGLAAGTYTSTITITPSAGVALTITITVTVN